MSAQPLLPPRTQPLRGAPAEAHDAARGVRVRFDVPEPVWLTAVAHVDVLAVILTLYACMVVHGEPLTLPYALLAAVAAALSGRCITAPDVRGALSYARPRPTLTLRLLLEWCTVVGLLLFVGFAVKASDSYSRSVLLTWFLVQPLVLAGSHRAQLAATRWRRAKDAALTRYVIVGVNAAGLELARRMEGRSLLGFFDFRGAQRAAGATAGAPFVGHCDGLAEFVDREAVNEVYITLPISNAPRIRRLLAELRNTTASVYFVPDVFAFNLIQARVVDVYGMPAVAVCDTPLRGSHGFSKRLADLVLTLAALLVLWPLLLAIALAVKLSSPGPVLFVQRRYGLDGGEIRVLKFRTMTVCEDGPEVPQARRGDRRITPLGRVLRRTSLDELPQLFNVLRGDMSLVGPRPHAIAHNEQYRRLISGYMVRHKVRPGLTGWAQVHGLRGETDTIDKMESRVRYDLDYLANWSLLLDLRILVRTVRIVLRGDNAH